MNEEFWDDLRQSIEGRCAWNSAGNCCRGVEEAYKAGMLRAAEICKSKHENMDSRLNYVAGWLDAEAAIRKEAVE